MTEPEEFDYIVVGAGTAGCVVATRLAETGAEVLLLEQGSDGSDENIARANLDHLFRLWKDQNHIFNYPMDPREKTKDRWPELMRGRTVGGSGAVNVMIHTRANRKDLDCWAEMGNDQWCFDKVLPYYRKSETDPGGETALRGGSGPIQLSRPAPSRYADLLQNAAVELGFDGPDCDFNGARQEGGVGLYQFAADSRGQRSSTAAAYLAPQRLRRNLSVRPGVFVTRVMLDETGEKPRATGIRYRRELGWFETDILARRQVILCAGALESPKLLMLSGIGPGAHVKDKTGSDAVVDLPGVGDNLQDHVIYGIQFKGTLAPPRLQFLTEVGLFANVNNSKGDDYVAHEGYPTVQFFMNAGIAERNYPWTPAKSFGIYPSLTRPETRGKVCLTSHDPRRPPVIEMNYLEAGDDLDIMINALRLALKLAETDALSEVSLGMAPIPLGPGVELKLDLNSPRQHFEDLLIRGARGLWHPVGTCAMGSDPRKHVVAQDLSVHGVDNLSVCDASVFPRITSGNPNATVIAIAEKFCAEYVPRHEKSHIRETRTTLRSTPIPSA